MGQLFSSACLADAVLVRVFSSRRRHTSFDCDWSSDVCSSDLGKGGYQAVLRRQLREGVLQLLTRFAANGGIHGASARKIIGEFGFTPRTPQMVEGGVRDRKSVV